MIFFRTMLIFGLFFSNQLDCCLNFSPNFSPRAILSNCLNHYFARCFCSKNTKNQRIVSELDYEDLHARALAVLRDHARGAHSLEQINEGSKESESSCDVKSFKSHCSFVSDSAPGDRSVLTPKSWLKVAPIHDRHESSESLSMKSVESYESLGNDSISIVNPADRDL